MVRAVESVNRVRSYILQVRRMRAAGALRMHEEEMHAAGAGVQKSAR